MARPKPRFKALHTAVSDGDLDKVRRLVGRGARLNKFDDLGKTPLHIAVQDERLDIAAYLIEAGANVNAHLPKVIGNTPLRDAAETCSLEMAKLLIDAGADPTIPGWMQLCALDKAANRKRGDGPAVYRLLVEATRQLPKAHARA